MNDNAFSVCAVLPFCFPSTLKLSGGGRRSRVKPVEGLGAGLRGRLSWLPSPRAVRGGGCGGCWMRPQGKPGRRFQGFLTAGSRTLSPDRLTHQFFYVMASLGLEVFGLLLGGVESLHTPHFWPSCVTAAAAGDRYRWKSWRWRILTEIPLQWWVSAACSFASWKPACWSDLTSIWGGSTGN